MLNMKARAAVHELGVIVEVPRRCAATMSKCGDAGSERQGAITAPPNGRSTVRTRAGPGDTVPLVVWDECDVERRSEARSAPSPTPIDGHTMDESGRRCS